jgi:hypothetical protein
MLENLDEFTVYEPSESKPIDSIEYFNENEDSKSQLGNSIITAFKDLFLPVPKNDPYDEGEIIENENIYFTETKKSTEKEIALIQMKEKKFKTNYFSLKKKRGRVSIAISRKKAPIHDKFSEDNLRRKIQVHFMSFIISFINDILKQLGHQQQFNKLSYDFKKNVTNSFFEELKTKKISDIICNNIRKKYKIDNIDFNRKLYENLKDKEVLKDLFDVNYLVFFKNIYYEKNITFLNSLSEKKIVLSSQIKTFEDLKQSVKKDNDYVEKLNLYVEENFLKNFPSH